MLAWWINEGNRTEEPIATVEAAGVEEVDEAMHAASKALNDPSWKRLPASNRGVLMARLATLMEQNQKLLAAIDAWDNGAQLYFLRRRLRLADSWISRQDLSRSAYERLAGSGSNDSILQWMGRQDVWTDDQHHR